MRRALYGACKRAGLRRFGWHTLRHSFATHLDMRKAPFKAIQDYMGHATSEMTSHYVHLLPSMGREVVNLLNLSGDNVNIASTRNTM